jgi:hypothetical protein
VAIVGVLEKHQLRQRRGVDQRGCVRGSESHDVVVAALANYDGAR